jgi:hypothetical protein
VCFKRVEQPRAKRQRTKNTKYYSAPFCKENHEKHKSSQHPVEWEKYEKASKEEKMEFFETMKYVSIESFIDTSGDILKFIVDLRLWKTSLHNYFCQGAVALAMNPGAIISRIARKTYGIGSRGAFEEGDPAEYCTQVGNMKKCENRFSIYVQKGSQVTVDHCVTKTHVGLYPRQKVMRLVLYSSDDVSPRYTKGGSAEKEGELVIDISNVSGETDAKPEVSVSMYFGRSNIEMKAVALNFGDKSKVHEMPLPLTFGGVLE